MLFLLIAGPNPGAPQVYQEVFNIPFANPGEWSPIVLSTSVPVLAGQTYAYLIDGGVMLMLGDYPLPGFDSLLGPNVDFAFHTYIGPFPQTDTACVG